MEKIIRFVELLEAIIESAKYEVQTIDAGAYSKWDVDQLINVVIPEMNEILQYALVNTVYFRFGRDQRMLESTYIIIDSMEDLWNTKLGNEIWELQRLYNML